VLPVTLGPIRYRVGSGFCFFFFFFFFLFCDSLSSPNITDLVVPPRVLIDHRFFPLLPRSGTRALSPPDPAIHARLSSPSNFPFTHASLPCRAPLYAPFFFFRLNFGLVGTPPDSPCGSGPVNPVSLSEGFPEKRRVQLPFLSPYLLSKSIAGFDSSCLLSPSGLPTTPLSRFGPPASIFSSYHLPSAFRLSIPLLRPLMRSMDPPSYSPLSFMTSNFASAFDILDMNLFPLSEVVRFLKSLFVPPCVIVLSYLNSAIFSICLLGRPGMGFDFRISPLFPSDCSGFPLFYSGFPVFLRFFFRGRCPLGSLRGRARPEIDVRISAFFFCLFIV